MGILYSKIKTHTIGLFQKLEAPPKEDTVRSKFQNSQAWIFPGKKWESENWEIGNSHFCTKNSKKKNCEFPFLYRKRLRFGEISVFFDPCDHKVFFVCFLLFCFVLFCF